MSPLEIKKGVVVLYKGRKVVIDNIIDLSNLEVVDIETGNSFKIPISEIEQIKEKESKPYHPIDPESPESRYFDIAYKRLEIIKPLLDSRDKTKVEERAKEFNLSPATLYRWIKKYEESGERLSSLVPSYYDRGGKSKKRLPREVEEIVDEIINDVYLSTSRRVSVKRAYQVLLIRCKELGLKPPHINTLRNRIRELSPEYISKKREGRAVSQGKYGASTGHFEVENPLEVVQIDHTPLDIIVVDEKTREPIGRPYLTLAVDVYSRMVYGYYLSLDAPGYFSVAQTLLTGILPKDTLLKNLGIDDKWEIWGLPKSIHVDNAKEFRSSYLESFCNEYGISINYRPRKTPHYGGHVERLIGTINREIHNLPGTTFSNTVERKEYKSEKHAVYTLFDLEKWLIRYIVTQYHKSVHSELEMTPEEKFAEGIFGGNGKLGSGFPKMISREEADKLRIAILPSFKRTIQKDGVHFFGVRYFDNVLKPFIGYLRRGEQPKKYTFKYDPRDMRFIYFQHPETKEYYKIPCRDRRLPRLSIWELRELKKKIGVNKRYNETQLIENIKELLEFEEEVEKKSKKLKRKRNSRVLYREKEKIEGLNTTGVVDEKNNIYREPDNLDGDEDLDDIEPFEVE
ncbi:Mu transposase C-terminal domain-containing protein [Hippea alviniae]|uniref:Mu transposase C-terminal domain-containing protein n=1 Tax=Hippea alviniae TaxID=1279027 RepID=UPI0003B409A4|nr:DDE-type integrase/transposase/recombinase [Hippea alviniae]